MWTFHVTQNNSYVHLLAPLCARSTSNVHRTLRETSVAGYLPLDILPPGYLPHLGYLTPPYKCARKLANMSQNKIYYMLFCKKMVCVYMYYVTNLHINEWYEVMSLSSRHWVNHDKSLIEALS